MEHDVLIPDVLNIIWSLVRASRPLHRAQLRRVSRYFRDADRGYVAPAWVSTHPDLALLPNDTSAWHDYILFVEDAFVHAAWAHVPRPLHIGWDIRISGDRPFNELRFQWPHCFYDNVLHVSERRCDDGTTFTMYKQGTTHQRTPGTDYVYDECMGMFTSYFEYVSWNMFPAKLIAQLGYPEPEWN